MERSQLSKLKKAVSETVLAGGWAWSLLKVVVIATMFQHTLHTSDADKANAAAANLPHRGRK